MPSKQKEKTNVDEEAKRAWLEAYAYIEPSSKYRRRVAKEIK